MKATQNVHVGLKLVRQTLPCLCLAIEYGLANYMYKYGVYVSLCKLAYAQKLLTLLKTGLREKQILH